MSNFIQTIKHSSGVYLIINKQNGWLYIGSSKNVNIRKKNHFYELNRGIHSNKHLQNSYTKNPKFFEFIIYEYTEHYKSLEQELLNNRFGINCYNVSKTVSFPTMSDEGRSNLSKSKIQMHKDKPWIREKAAIARRCDRVKHIQSETAKKQRLNPEYTKNLTNIIREKLKKFHDVWVIDENNKEYHIGWNLREFCRKHDLDRGNFMKILNKKQKNCKGWKLKNG